MPDCCAVVSAPPGCPSAYDAQRLPLDGPQKKRRSDTRGDQGRRSLLDPFSRGRSAIGLQRRLGLSHAGEEVVFDATSVHVRNLSALRNTSFSGCRLRARMARAGVRSVDGSGPQPSPVTSQQGAQNAQPGIMPALGIRTTSSFYRGWALRSDAADRASLEICWRYG